MLGPTLPPAASSEFTKITLDLDKNAVAWLGRAGYDPVYGTRPLKRVIQRELQNPLATMILEGRVREGDTVHVTAGDRGLVVDGVQAAAA